MTDIFGFHVLLLLVFLPANTSQIGEESIFSTNYPVLTILKSNLLLANCLVSRMGGVF